MIERLPVPVKEALAGRLPGRFVIAVREKETTAACVDFKFAHEEIARLVLDAARQLAVDETTTLRSEQLPFEMQLHLRHKNDSSLVLYTDIEGEPATAMSAS